MPSSDATPAISGQFLEAAVVAGLASAGVDVLLLGVLPTPGVAYLTGALDADLGVMLSASHNPMPDNGIKFLARGGVKLDDALEQAIENRLREPWERPTGGASAGSRRTTRRSRDYAAHLVSHRSATRSTGSRSSSTARTAPPPSPGRRRSRAPAPRSSRSAPSPTG